MATVWPLPAATLTQVLSVPTRTGLFCCPPVLTRPSWPLALLPQTQSEPSGRTATVWLPPAATMLARANRAVPAGVVPPPVVAVMGPLCAAAGTRTPVSWVPSALTLKPVLTVRWPALP